MSGVWKTVTPAKSQLEMKIHERKGECSCPHVKGLLWNRKAALSKHTALCCGMALSALVLLGGRCLLLTVVVLVRKQRVMHHPSLVTRIPISSGTPLDHEGRGPSLYYRLSKPTSSHPKPWSAVCSITWWRPAPEGMDSMMAVRVVYCMRMYVCMRMRYAAASPRV